MKRMTLFTVMMTIAAMLSISAFAADAPKDNAKAEKPALHNQTHCPVMGGEIDSTVWTDIQGQRVYHCCPMCSAKLKADPDKYFKQAAAEGVLFENIQTECPVSHEVLENKDNFTDYEGRRIYFCCDKCVKSFAKDPQKYLSKMSVSDSESESGSKSETKMDHKSMDHGDMHHDGNGGK